MAGIRGYESVKNNIYMAHSCFTWIHSQCSSLLKTLHMQQTREFADFYSYLQHTCVLKVVRVLDTSYSSDLAHIML